MNHLTSHDLGDVLKIGRTAVDAKDVDELRRTVVHNVEQAFKAEFVHFWLMNGPDEFAYDTVHYCGVDERFKQQYRGYYRTRNPWLRGNWNGAFFPTQTTVVRHEQMFSRKEWDKLEFYNDLQKPYGLYHELLIYLVSRNQPLGAVSIMRRRETPNFTRDEKLKADLIAPVLTSATLGTIVKQQSQSFELAIDLLMADLPAMGVLLLDEYLRPLRVNNYAKAILDMLTHRRAFPRTSSLAIPDEVYQACKQLKAEAHPARPAEPRERQVFVTARRPRREVRIGVRYIEYPDMPSVFLVMFEPDDPVYCLSDELSRRGLTPREVEVVYLMGQGLTNKEIAQKLFISPKTVGAHQYNIFQKLGVNTRTGVLNLMLRKVYRQEFDPTDSNA